MNPTDIKDKSPNTDTINYLERLLQQAKDGEIRTVVVAIGWDDDCVTTGWVLDSRNTRMRLIAGVALLNHEFLTNQNLRDSDSVLSQALNAD